MVMIEFHEFYLDAKWANGPVRPDQIVEEVYADLKRTVFGRGRRRVWDPLFNRVWNAAETNCRGKVASRKDTLSQQCGR